MTKQNPRTPAKTSPYAIAAEILEIVLSTPGLPLGTVANAFFSNHTSRYLHQLNQWRMENQNHVPKPHWKTLIWLAEYYENTNNNPELRRLINVLKAEEKRREIKPPEAPMDITVSSPEAVGAAIIRNLRHTVSRWTHAELAKHIPNATQGRIGSWLRINRVPEAYWPDLIKTAEKHGFRTDNPELRELIDALGKALEERRKAAKEKQRTFDLESATPGEIGVAIIKDIINVTGLTYTNLTRDIPNASRTKILGWLNMNSLPEPYWPGVIAAAERHGFKQDDPKLRKLMDAYKSAIAAPAPKTIAVAIIRNLLATIPLLTQRELARNIPDAYQGKIASWLHYNSVPEAYWPSIIAAAEKLGFKNDNPELRTLIEQLRKRIRPLAEKKDTATKKSLSEISAAGILCNLLDETYPLDSRLLETIGKYVGVSSATVTEWLNDTKDIRDIYVFPLLACAENILSAKGKTGSIEIKKEFAVKALQQFYRLSPEETNLLRTALNTGYYVYHGVYAERIISPAEFLERAGEREHWPDLSRAGHPNLQLLTSQFNDWKRGRFIGREKLLDLTAMLTEERHSLSGEATRYMSDKEATQFKISAIIHNLKSYGADIVKMGFVSSTTEVGAVNTPGNPGKPNFRDRTRRQPPTGHSVT